MREEKGHVHDGGLFSTGFGRAGRTRAAVDAKRIVLSTDDRGRGE